MYVFVYIEWKRLETRQQCVNIGSADVYILYIFIFVCICIYFYICIHTCVCVCVLMGGRGGGRFSHEKVYSHILE